MDSNTWRNRISNRTDLVARLTHLTRGQNDEEAFEVLWRILTEKKLIGSGNDGYIVGSSKAVCFQEVPLYSIVENLLYEETLNGKIRYSWFGLRFNKVWMHRQGARPVIYGKTQELKRILPASEHWRIVNMDFETENPVDWSHEREWRICGDYFFEYGDIEILVKNDEYYKKFVEKCISQGKTDLLRDVHGIIPLNTVIS